MSVLRTLAGVISEILVVAIGLAIAAPYFLVLASPFVTGD